MTEQEKLAHEKLLAAARQQRLRERKSKAGIPVDREIDRVVALGVRKFMDAGDMETTAWDAIKAISETAMNELRRGNVDVRNPATRAAIRKRFGVRPKEPAAASPSP